MRLRLLSVAAAAVMSTATVNAAGQQGPVIDAGKPVIIGQSLTVRSKILNELVPVEVYLPPGYAASQARYPVLIAFMTRLPVVAGIVDGLSGHTIPPMIAVSVSIDPSMYSLEVDERSPISGRAPAVLRFLQEELVPWIDARYRTRPLRIGFGSSSSAIFAIYALFSAPDLFRSAIAAGPMFAEFDYARVSAILEAALARRAANAAVLFYTQGDQPELTSDLRSFEAMLKRHAASGRGALRWAFDPEPGENHGSLAQKTLHDGLRTLFSDWAQLSERMADEGIGAIKAHKARLAAFFGYDIGLGRAAYAPVRARLTREKRYDLLVELLKLASEDRPDDYYSYLSLAIAHQQAGQLREAAAAYETAIVKARATESKETQARVLPRLQAALDAVRGKQ